MSNRNVIADFFFASSDKCIDKWEHYLEIYENELSRFIASDIPVRLLEIGIQNGGSLELWKSILPECSIIMGIDKDPRVRDLSFTSDRIGVKCLDATDSSAIKDVLGDQQFDIIIDDGSHFSDDIIRSFQLLFDHLAPSGKYIIEDLHCSYYSTFKGGFKRTESSIEFLKGIIDAVNFDHISPAEHLSEDTILFLSQRNAEVAKVVFYDSVCVVSKLGRRKNRPYRRIRSGSDDQVQSYKSWISTMDPDLIESTVFSISAENTFERSYLDLIQNYKKNELDLRLVTDNQDIIINSQLKIIDGLKNEIELLRGLPNQVVE